MLSPEVLAAINAAVASAFSKLEKRIDERVEAAYRRARSEARGDLDGVVLGLKSHLAPKLEKIDVIYERAEEAAQYRKVREELEEEQRKKTAQALSDRQSMVDISLKEAQVQATKQATELAPIESRTRRLALPVSLLVALLTVIGGLIGAAIASHHR